MCARVCVCVLLLISMPTYAWSDICLYAQTLVWVFRYMSIHVYVCGGWAIGVLLTAAQVYLLLCRYWCAVTTCHGRLISR